MLPAVSHPPLAIVPERYERNDSLKPHVISQDRTSHRSEVRQVVCAATAGVANTHRQEEAEHQSKLSHATPPVRTIRR
jgi:hypothetical protein